VCADVIADGTIEFLGCAWLVRHFAQVVLQNEYSGELLNRYTRVVLDDPPEIIGNPILTVAIAADSKCCLEKQSLIIGAEQVWRASFSPAKFLVPAFEPTRPLMGMARHVSRPSHRMGYPFSLHF
jgi:hypothetical protein